MDIGIYSGNVRRIRDGRGCSSYTTSPEWVVCMRPRMIWLSATTHQYDSSGIYRFEAQHKEFGLTCHQTTRCMMIDLEELCVTDKEVTMKVLELNRYLKSKRWTLIIGLSLDIPAQTVRQLQTHSWIWVHLLIEPGWRQGRSRLDRKWNAEGNLTWSCSLNHIISVSEAEEDHINGYLSMRVLDHQSLVEIGSRRQKTQFRDVHKKSQSEKIHEE